MLPKWHFTQSSSLLSLRVLTFKKLIKASVLFPVGSIAFDRLICENRQLRRDREVLNQKLARSKAALQDTLVRLARSNMHKQDQVKVSPAAARRPASRQLSERGGSADPTNCQSHMAASPAFSRRNDGYDQSHLAASPAFTRRHEAGGHPTSGHLAVSPAFSRRNVEFGDNGPSSPLGSDPWQSHRWVFDSVFNIFTVH